MTATAAPAHARLGFHRFRSMGTDVVVALPAGREAAAEPVKRLFDEWDRRFSRFRPDSELATLNRAAGTSFDASQPMFDALSTAVAAARATDGRFDPLLAGRMAELGYDQTFDELPVERPVAALRPWHAGEWRDIRLDAASRTVTIPPGSGLDLGGLAKGMAVDAAIGRLAATGVAFAAVNAGGDLAVLGTPPGETAWDVALDGVDAPVSLSSGALATSSVLRRRWRVDGATRHHVLDPRTGLPVDNDLAQVTVAATTCTQAEVAAKAVLLLGATAGTDFVERGGLSALLVTRAGSALRAGSWR